MGSKHFPRQRRALMLAGLGAAAAATAATSVRIWPWTGAKPYPEGDPLPVDLSALPEGQLLTLSWQDKPVWVLRRSAADLATLPQHEGELTDAQSKESVQPAACCNAHRALKPEIFVAVGLCTHQGCTPYLNPGKGFICPCHGSRYDLAGRVFDEGPAPANLLIPAYRFASAQQLIIGELA